MPTRSFLSSLLGFALVVCLASSASGIVVRHDKADADYIELGSKPEFDCVGVFARSTEHVFCSNVLIAPEWVITAAHAVDMGLEKGDRIRIGGASWKEGVETSVAEIVVHPGWGKANGFDIALVRLAKPVKDIEPARIYTGKDELDYDLVLVGYGMNGTGLTGSSESDGLKRGCQNRIDEYIGPESQVMGIMFDAPPSGLPLEGKGGPGDSGSAAFVVIDGKYWLAGIGAGGSDVNEDGIQNGYGDLDKFTRVGPVSQWVKKTAGLQ